MHDRIKHLIDRELEGQKQWELEMLEREQHHKAAMQRCRNELMPCLVPAKPRHYKKWLRGYMESGGAPTHYYRYKMPDNFYLAVSDFRIFPLYGSEYVNIIVPSGINCDMSEGTGHCGIYFMDGYRKADDWQLVPVYTNTIV